MGLFEELPQCVNHFDIVWGEWLEGRQLWGWAIQLCNGGAIHYGKAFDLNVALDAIAAKIGVAELGHDEAVRLKALADANCELVRLNWSKEIGQYELTFQKTHATESMAIIGELQLMLDWAPELLERGVTGQARCNSG